MTFNFINPINWGAIQVETVAPFGDFYVLNAPPGQPLKYVQVELWNAHHQGY